MTITDIVNSCVNIAPYVSIGLLINQVFPITLYLRTDEYKKDLLLKPPNTFEDDDIYEHLPAGLSTLDYVNVANSIVHNHWRGVGACIDYSYATFYTYKGLTELNHREDLQKNIRLAVGFVKFGPLLLAHCQIEYEQDGRFSPYETLVYTPPLEVNSISNYSAETKDEKTKEGLDYCVVRSLRGTLSFYPTPSALLIIGGFARILISQLIFNRMIRRMSNDEIEKYLSSLTPEESRIASYIIEKCRK